MANSTISYCTICVLVLCMTSIHCSPIKRSTNQQGTDCYGTDCYVDLDAPVETVIDVTFPENLTQAILVALPNIEGAQNRAVELLENMIALPNIESTQNRAVALLENMTTTISAGIQTQNQQMADVVRLLQSQMSIPSTTSTSLHPARDCQDIGAYNSGPYVITPHDNLGSFTVYCDMETDGGGWTVFQRRFDGSVDFYRGWNDYEVGFGSPDGEYWLGLQKIYRLTTSGAWILRIDMEKFDGSTQYAQYESFQVGDARTYYRLSIGSYSGNGSDRLTGHHNNRAFTTKDRDNDADSSRNCATSWKGAWWYNNCHSSNLNGLYLGPSGNSLTGMVWRAYSSLKRAEMKIRRVQ